MKRRQWLRFIGIVPVWISLASAALAVPFFAVPDNLVKNSSFEQPSIPSQKLIGRPSDWKVTSTKAGDILRPGIRIRKVSDAPDGNQVVELNSVIRVKVSQKLSVLPHATYKVSWMQKTVQSIYETTFSGVETDTAVLGGTECEPVVSEWYQCSYNVTIDDSDEVALFIQAENTGSYGNLIDDVQVVLLSAPQPSPTNTTSNTPTPSPTTEPTTIIETPTVEPTPTVSEPSDNPSPSQSEASPSASDEPSPTELPTEPAPLPTPDMTDLTPEPAPSGLIDNPSIPETVMLKNGVVLPIDVADALQAVDSPIEAITTAFTNPKKFFKALNNVGADLAPPVRKKAQSVVISAIIVVQIAGNIAAMLVRKI